MKSAKGRNTTEVSQLPTILSMPEKVGEQPVGLHQFFHPGSVVDKMH